MSPRTYTRCLPVLLGLVLLGAIAPVQAETYDPNGNLLTRPSQQGTVTTTYDALDRLESETGPSINQSFTYDPNGNRESDGTNTYIIAPNGNRLLTINGVTQVYDPAGNLLDDGQGKTYTYNAVGRLKEIRMNSILVATYTYNSRGLRTRKVTPQGTILYHYDRQGHLIHTTDATGAPQTTTIWVDDKPIAHINQTGPTEKVAYLHTDHLNTSRTATDANQTIVWRWEGNAFGSTPPDEDPDSDGTLTTINLRFPGQYYDAESGCHYNGFRYYCPDIGRYLTSDPIGLHGGLNTYLYANANPLRFTDPTGEVSVAPVIIGIGALCARFPQVCINAARAIGAGIGIGIGSEISQSSSNVIPFPDSNTGTQADESEQCPTDDSDGNCFEWKMRLLAEFENIQTLELITGKLNHNSRTIYRTKARAYNRACGNKTGRISEIIGTPF